MMQASNYNPPQPAAPPPDNDGRWLALLIRRLALTAVHEIEARYLPEEYEARQAYKRWRERRP